LPSPSVATSATENPSDRCHVRASGAAGLGDADGLVTSDGPVESGTDAPAGETLNDPETLGEGPSARSAGRLQLAASAIANVKAQHANVGRLIMAPISRRTRTLRFRRLAETGPVVRMPAGLHALDPP
jgi:hypothetical protein